MCLSRNSAWNYTVPFPWGSESTPAHFSPHFTVSKEINACQSTCLLNRIGMRQIELSQWELKWSLSLPLFFQFYFESSSKSLCIRELWACIYCSRYLLSWHSCMLCKSVALGDTNLTGWMDFLWAKGHLKINCKAALWHLWSRFSNLLKVTFLKNIVPERSFLL